MTALDPFTGLNLGNPFVAPDGCSIYFAADTKNGKNGAKMYVITALP